MPERDALDPAELWFVAHGLPYFVDSYRARVAGGLQRGRIAVVVAIASAVGLVVGLVTAVPLSAAAGVGAALSATGLVLATYAVATLRAWLIVGWALRRTFSSLGLLLPLVTRALPLLLLFAGVAVGFLLTRLPEELDSVDDEVDSHELLDACRGTPLEAAAEAIAGRVERVGAVDAEVTGLQKVNLVLVLLVSQAVQVLLLALSVFAFFILFGVVAMDPDV